MLLTYDPDLDTLTPGDAVTRTAAGVWPITLVYTRAVSPTNQKLAIVTPDAQPAVLAYIGTFDREDDRTFTASLNTNDPRLTGYLLRGGTAALALQFAATIGGESRSPSQPAVQVKLGAFNGAEQSITGPVYLTSDDIAAALAAYALKTVAGKYRIKTDGTVEFWNTDELKFHPFAVRGAAGAEVITIGAGED